MLFDAISNYISYIIVVNGGKDFGVLKYSKLEKVFLPMHLYVDETYDHKIHIMNMYYY